MKTIGRQIKEAEQLIERMQNTAVQAELIINKYQEDIETLLCQNDAGIVTKVDEEYVPSYHKGVDTFYKITLFTNLSACTQEQLISIRNGLNSVEEFKVNVGYKTIEIYIRIKP